MGADSLYWGDGLFLRPQHFQQMERQSEDKRSLAERWNTPFAYGLHKIEIDQDALSNWRLSLSNCHLKFPDGTVCRFPEDAHIAAVGIPKDLFAAERADFRVRVYVGIAQLRHGTNNTSGKSASRYLKVENNVQDENAADNPQPVEFRKLNLQILIGDRQKQGYDSVPIMQLKPGTTAESPPQLDRDYAPPLLVADAWDELQTFVKSVYDRLSGQAEVFARQMTDRGVAFSSGNKEDFERILHLHALNTALGSVAWLPFTAGVHPFVIYQQLCQAAGRLAVFRRQRRLSELPVYNHDDPMPCFRRLARLLEIEKNDDDYQKRAFTSEGKLMAVRLEQDWLADDWQFFIGVQSEASDKTVDDLLSEKGLGLKVANRDDVDRVYIKGRRGVSWSLVGQPPRSFPRENYHYFQVARDSSAWDDVIESLNLGLRFNEDLVENNQQGDNRLEAREQTSVEVVSMQFWLFAIRNS